MTSHNSSLSALKSHPHETSASTGLVVLLGIAVGVIAANLYYAQPLVSLISKSLGLAPEAAGLIVTLTQIGYGLAVLFIVPLGDLLENRKLILSMIGLGILSLIGLTFANHVLPYFAAALAIGVGAAAVQVIVPFAAHLTPEESRGRVVGNLMSGLMLGIMLSRPIASILTDLFSWHAVFLLSACFMSLLWIALFIFLPVRQPAKLNIQYGTLIVSMAQLFLRTPILRRRAIYQSFLFGAFCLFWTAVPMYLAGPTFNLSQTAIALFALAGVAGAVSAPFTGRLADRGWSRQATMTAMTLSAIAFPLTHIFAPGSTISLVVLVFCAILLDAGITANLVLGQRAIFSLRAKYRSRLNGLYIATIFIGGAFGSSVGALAYARGGWELTSWVGFALPIAALIYFATEWLTGYQKSKRTRR